MNTAISFVSSVNSFNSSVPFSIENALQVPLFVLLSVDATPQAMMKELMGINNHADLRLEEMGEQEIYKFLCDVFEGNMTGFRNRLTKFDLLSSINQIRIYMTLYIMSQVIIAQNPEKKAIQEEISSSLIQRLSCLILSEDDYQNFMQNPVLDIQEDGFQQLNEQLSRELTQKMIDQSIISFEEFSAGKSDSSLKNRDKQGLALIKKILASSVLVLTPYYLKPRIDQKEKLPDDHDLPSNPSESIKPNITFLFSLAALVVVVWNLKNICLRTAPLSRLVDLSDDDLFPEAITSEHQKITGQDISSDKEIVETHSSKWNSQAKEGEEFDEKSEFSDDDQPFDVEDAQRKFGLQDEDDNQPFDVDALLDDSFADGDNE